MKNSTFIVLAFVSSLVLVFSSLSDADEHGQEKHEQSHDEDHEDEHKGDHGDDHDHNESKGSHEDEHGAEEDGHGHSEHDEGEGSKIGPNKAITEQGKLGFKLAPEATKTLGLAFEAYHAGTGSIPCRALVQIKGETFIFRLRQSWIKKEKIQVLARSAPVCKVKSSGLAAGDQVATEGVSFLRLTEISLTETATHSH